MNDLSFPPDTTRYELKHIIGVGHASRVYESICKDNKQVLSIKTVELEDYPLNFDTIQRQTRFWSVCDHPNIVKYYGSFLNGSKIWMLSEYMESGSLEDILRSDYPEGLETEALIATLLKDVLLALEYFHANHQIHRDLRSNNILVSGDGIAKLSDFGMASSLIKGGQRKMSTLSMYGDPCYMAPEILKNENGYSEKTDIWSLGLTAIELGTGKMPYSDLKFMEALAEIIDNEPPALPEKGYSSAFKEFVKLCCTKDPEKRPTASLLLSHKFIKQAKNSEYVVEYLVSQTEPQSTRFYRLHPPEDYKEVKMIKERPDLEFDFDEKAIDSTQKNNKSEVKKRGRFQITRSPSSNMDLDVICCETNPPPPKPNKFTEMSNEITQLKQQITDLESSNANILEKIGEIAAAIRILTS